MTIPVVPTDPPLTNEASPSPKRAPSAMRNMVVSLLGDVGLPVAAYFVAELLGASTYRSLLVGTVVAGLRIGWVAIRERRFDVFATFLLVLFGAGFVLTFVTGDVRFVLAKDATTSAVAGLIFLSSCILNRPLAYYAAKRFAGAAGSGEFNASADTPIMRKRWYRVSLVWGVGLLTDAALRIACIYLLSPDIAANVSQALMVTAYTLLIAYTIYTAKKTARQHSAMSPSAPRQAPGVPNSAVAEHNP
jgi:intracellular septation protein A